MEKQAQLSEVMTQRILHEIKDGTYKNESKLPPELEIAAYLGVSRSIIRDSLSALEREGFISRKQGVGTIINRHVLSVVTRMDLEEEFLDMIANTGKVAGLLRVSVSYGLAEEQLAQKLKIQPNTEVIHVTRVITADGQPAIYCIDSFSKALIRDGQYEEEDLRKPIFDFLTRFCHTEVFMDLTEVKLLRRRVMSQAAFRYRMERRCCLWTKWAITLRVRPFYTQANIIITESLPTWCSEKRYSESGFNEFITHMVLRKKI